MHITHVKDFSFSPYAMKWVIVHSNNKMLQSFSFMFCNVTHDMLTSKCKEGYLFICDGGDEPSWEQMAMGSYDKTICPDSSAGKNTFPYACHVSWITMSYSKWLMYQYNDCHLAQCSWRWVTGWETYSEWVMYWNHCMREIGLQMSQDLLKIADFVSLLFRCPETHDWLNTCHGQ